MTSPHEATTTTVQTWWAPGPVRFDADTEVVDVVGAGESLRITPEFGPETPDWVGDDGVTCVVLAFWDQNL